MLKQLSTSWPSVPRDEMVHALRAFSEKQGAVLYGAAGVGKSHLARLVRARLDRDSNGGIFWVTVSGDDGDTAVDLSAADELLAEINSAGMSARRLARTVHQRLLEQAGSRPVHIQVEDAQLIDSGTLDLVAAVCRLGGVSLLCTARATTPALVGLCRDELVDRIDVPTLTGAEIDTLLWAALDGPVDGGVARAVLHATGGNAKLVREIVRANLATGTVVRSHGTWILRGALRPDHRMIESVRIGIRQLSEAERHAVQLIAMAEPLPLHVAGTRISDDVLDRLLSRNLVRLTDGRTLTRRVLPTVRLLHPLYGECIRRTVTPSLSHDLHRSIYPNVTNPGQQTASGLVRWAEWTLECGLDPDTESLVAAAKAASTLGRYDLAVDLATAALEVAVEPRHRIEALAVRARELRFLDRPVHALRDAEDAIALHVATPPDETVTTAHALLDLHELAADIQQYGLDRPHAAIELMDEAYAGVVEGGGNMAHVQRYRMSRISRHGWSGDFRPALATVKELGAGQVPVTGWRLQGVGPAIMGLTCTGRSTEAMVLADRYAATATSYDAAMPRVGAEIHLTTFHMLLVTGHIEEARKHGADPRAISSVTRMDPALTFAGEGRLLSAEGRWHEADERFRAAHELFNVKDPSGFAAWAFAGEALCALMVGDAPRAEDLCQLVDQTPLRASRALEADLRAQVIATLAGMQHPDAPDRADAMAAWARKRGHHLVELWALDLIASIDVDHAREIDAVARARHLLRLVDAPVAPALVNHVVAAVDADRRLEDAATAQLARFGRWVPQRPSVRSPLSPREAEVASLVTAGFSSPAIADRLHLSTRTVETHLAKIYTKLGVNRRSQVSDALRDRTA